MQHQGMPLPAREMNKIVWLFVGVFGLIAVSFPIALKRVADHEKFAGFHVKSLTIDYQQPAAKVLPVAQETPPQPTPEIEVYQREKLKTTLYETLNNQWQTAPKFEKNLVYLIHINGEGKLRKIEPVNQIAQTYQQETPLPNLLSNSSPEITEALAKFTVVFTPAGLLEISE